MDQPDGAGIEVARTRPAIVPVWLTSCGAMHVIAGSTIQRSAVLCKTLAAVWIERSLHPHMAAVLANARCLVERLLCENAYSRHGVKHPSDEVSLPISRYSRGRPIRATGKVPQPYRATNTLTCQSLRTVLIVEWCTSTQSAERNISSNVEKRVRPQARDVREQTVSVLANIANRRHC